MPGPTYVLEGPIPGLAFLGTADEVHRMRRESQFLDLCGFKVTYVLDCDEEGAELLRRRIHPEPGSLTVEIRPWVRELLERYGREWDQYTDAEKLGVKADQAARQAARQAERQAERPAAKAVDMASRLESCRARAQVR